MEQKTWIISVNMGYGHQRTAYSLKSLAEKGKIINANNYPGIPERDRKIWATSQRFYEFISNFYRFPLIGKISFKFFDQLQKILTFYPKRDLSKPNFTLKQIYSLFKKGWGKHLIENLKLKNPNLPIISTFFIPAFMAEYFNYPGEIFCVVCDADIARTWAPLEPQKSKIKYFSPTERVVERLKFYGVRPENIFLTGYPLPLENIGSQNLEILKEDIRYRILNLDPKRRYFEKYKTLIKEYLEKLPEKSDQGPAQAGGRRAGWSPLTLMFSVGGAGVQKEIATKILKCLRWHLKQREIKIILSVGIREKVKEYFEREIKKLKLSKNLTSEQIEIIFEKDIESYFQKFNQALRKTDILWTKPSELSFYSALGIPIIIAPPIGSQEEFNKRWLLKSGFGISQENPNYTDQWLFDWLNNGYFAEIAMEGFIEGKKLGTIKISKIINQLKNEKSF